MDVFDLMAKISVDTSDYESALSDASEKSTSFASGAGNKLKTAFGGIAKASAITAGAFTAVSGALVKNASNVAKQGDAIDKQSQKLGISSKAYQEWNAVLQHSGTSMDAMGASFNKLSRASQDASKDQVEAFKKIGISMEEVASLSTEELWSRTIAGLQGMEEGTERTAIATELLGGGAKQLGALLNTTNEDTQAMIKTVNELGGVMSEDAVKASAEFQDNLQDLTTGFEAVKNQVGMAVIPILNDFMSTAIDNMPQIQEAFSAFFEGAKIVFSGLWDAITTVFESIKEAVGTVTESFEGAGISWGDIWEGIKSVINGAVSAITLAIATIGQLIGWLVTEATTDGTLINAVWTSIHEGLSTAWEIMKGVFDTIMALLGGDWTLAWETMRDALTTAVRFVKNVFVNSFNVIKNNFTNVFNAISDIVDTVFGGAMDALMGFAQDAYDFVTGIFQDIADFVNGIVDAIASAWEAVTTVYVPEIEGAHAEGWAGDEPMWTYDPFKYAKAMTNAYVLNGATTFGTMNGRPLVGGESGSEMVVGTNALFKSIAQASGGDYMRYAFEKLFEILGEYLPNMGNQKIVLDTGAVVGGIVDDMKFEIERMNRRESLR